VTSSTVLCVCLTPFTSFKKNKNILLHSFYPKSFPEKIITIFMHWFYSYSRFQKMSHSSKPISCTHRFTYISWLPDYNMEHIVYIPHCIRAQSWQDHFHFDLYYRPQYFKLSAIHCTCTLRAVFTYNKNSMIIRVCNKIVTVVTWKALNFFFLLISFAFYGPSLIQINVTRYCLLAFMVNILNISFCTRNNCAYIHIFQTILFIKY